MNIDWENERAHGVKFKRSKFENKSVAVIHEDQVNKFESGEQLISGSETPREIIPPHPPSQRLLC